MTTDRVTEIEPGFGARIEATLPKNGQRTWSHGYKGWETDAGVICDWEQVVSGYGPVFVTRPSPLGDHSEADKERERAAYQALTEKWRREIQSAADMRFRINRIALDHPKKREAEEASRPWWRRVWDRLL